MNKKPVVGIIGAGQWGQNIVRVMNELATVKTVAVRDTVKYTEMAQKYPKINFSDDYQNILTDSEVTHVCIATPIDTHVDITGEVLKAGKHVLVEKPLANNETEVKNLYNLASHNQLALLTNYLYCLDPTLDEIMTKLPTTKGQVTYQSTWHKWGSFDESIVDNLLVHDIALACKLLGSITTISHLELETDLVTIHFEHENGRSEIEINRRIEDKKSRITTVTIGGEQTSFSPAPQLLDKQLSYFLTLQNANRNTDAEKTDLGVAQALQLIKQQIN